jgi:hypothetical protein
MKTKQEVKRNIMHKIMGLRTKDMIEEDCILDVLDDNLDPYITELENNLDQATEIIKFLINPQLLDKPQYYEWRLKAEKFIKE